RIPTARRCSSPSPGPATGSWPHDRCRARSFAIRSHRRRNVCVLFAAGAVGSHPGGRHEGERMSVRRRTWRVFPALAVLGLIAAACGDDDDDGGGQGATSGGGGGGSIWGRLAEPA